MSRVGGRTPGAGPAGSARRDRDRAAGAVEGGARGREPAAGARGWARRAALPLCGVVAAVALVAAVLGSGLRHDPTVIRSPLVGRPAPDFALRRLDGKGALRLGDLRGQVVIVNFWASWCTECRVEHPALAAAWQRFRDAGVVLVGVDFQDTRDDAQAYLAGSGATWPAVEDPGSRTALAYGVYGIPETFFIGPDGRIAAKHTGPVSYDQIVAEVGRLLPGSAG
jgi:cytochrome c biogenesis protein CcmG, thiol:disulfide interchange protein DsbE